MCPHLHYDDELWSPILNKQCLLVERIRGRATNLLLECKDMSYSASEGDHFKCSRFFTDSMSSICMYLS